MMILRFAGTKICEMNETLVKNKFGSFELILYSV